METYILQHIQVLVVGKGDVIHRDLTPDVLQFYRVGGVLQVRLGAHELCKAAQARKAVGKHLGKIHQLPHGTGKGGNIEGEGQQVHHFDAVVDGQRAADGNDRHRQNGHEEFKRAGKNTHFLVKFPLGGLKTLVGVVEFPKFHFLVGKGLGRADAGKRGLDLRVDGGGAALDLLGNGAHFPAAENDHRQ